MGHACGLSFGNFIVDAPLQIAVENSCIRMYTFISIYI